MELETVSMIKSCIVSRKGGVPFVELSGKLSVTLLQTVIFILCLFVQRLRFVINVTV
jgi:hypothetical protein